jgi:signal peptidase II
VQLASLIIFSVLAFDQGSKFLAWTGGRNFICNTGFAFGFLQGILNGLIAFSVLVIVVWIFLKHLGSSSSDRVRLGNREVSSITIFALALIIGGGLSNLIDRLIRGCVVDFINWPRLTWLPLPDWILSSLSRLPAFNLADAAITVGTIALIASFFKSSSKYYKL